MRVEWLEVRERNNFMDDNERVEGENGNECERRKGEGWGK